MKSKRSIAILMAVSVLLGACAGDSGSTPGVPPPAGDSEDSDY